MHTVNAYAAKEAGGQLEKFSFTLEEIGREEVDIKVLYCGLCYSDIEMISNSWGFSQYPLVPGHEIVGEVIRTGSDTHGLKVGDKVGLGWFSRSCMHCPHCMQGDHQLCTDIEQVVVGRHGGFADTVRAHWSWTTKLPEGIDMAKAGPLFCGGSTVFTPIIMENVRPTDKVGVIGIGGLGHLAIRFLKHWGCEVIAFSSNRSKEAEILEMGAARVIDSTDESALQSIRGQLNFILNTSTASLNWNTYLECLAPKGKFHTVGIMEEPMQVSGWNLISGGKSVAGSPGASPALTSTMLEFCVRHNIYPTVQEFPMDQVNEAIQHLKAGKARYRVVLRNN